MTPTDTWQRSARHGLASHELVLLLESRFGTATIGVDGVALDERIRAATVSKHPTAPVDEVETLRA